MLATELIGLLQKAVEMNGDKVVVVGTEYGLSNTADVVWHPDDEFVQIELF